MGARRDHWLSADRLGLQTERVLPKHIQQRRNLTRENTPKSRLQGSERALEARPGDGKGVDLGIRKGAQGFNRHLGENAHVRSSEKQTSSAVLRLDLVLRVKDPPLQS